MKSLLGVVYDAQTLAVRRIIIPDNDREVLDGRHLGPGEAMATAPLSQGKDLYAAIAAVTRKTGRTPPPMADVHAADKLAMGMNGGKLAVR
jgi:hypothetical protein